MDQVKKKYFGEKQSQIYHAQNKIPFYMTLPFIKQFSFKGGNWEINHEERNN